MSAFLFHLSEILRLLDAKFHTTAADMATPGKEAEKPNEATKTSNGPNKKKKSKFKEFCQRKALTYTINGLKTVLFMGVAFVFAVG